MCVWWRASSLAAAAACSLRGMSSPSSDGRRGRDGLNPGRGTTAFGCLLPSWLCACCFRSNDGIVHNFVSRNCIQSRPYHAMSDPRARSPGIAPTLQRPHTCAGRRAHCLQRPVLSIDLYYSIEASELGGDVRSKDRRCLLSTDRPIDLNQIDKSNPTSHHK